MHEVAARDQHNGGAADEHVLRKFGTSTGG